LSDGMYLKQIDDVISFEDFKAGLNKWRKRGQLPPQVDDTWGIISFY
jgi:hypothetical protein